MVWLWAVLGALVALGALIARTRLGLRVAVFRSGASADLTVGPLRVRLAPRPPKKDRKAGAAKPKQEKTPPPERRPVKLPRITPEDILEGLRLLAPAGKKALRRTRRSIRVAPLELSVTLPGGEDPASAAVLYGRIQAAVWTGMPQLERLVHISDPHIHIGLDYDAETIRAEGQFGLSIRIGTLIALGLDMAVPAIRWLLNIQKRHKTPPKTEGAAHTDNTDAA